MSKPHTTTAWAAFALAALAATLGIAEAATPTTTLFPMHGDALTTGLWFTVAGLLFLTSAVCWQAVTIDALRTRITQQRDDTDRAVIAVLAQREADRRRTQPPE